MPKSTLTHMPAIIFYILTIMMCSIIYAVLFVNIPETSQNIAFNVFGNIQTAWIGSIAYWINTTRSSAIKTDIIAQSEPVRTE